MSYVYHGTIGRDGKEVSVNDRPLSKRFDLARHSPDGFEWGYGGSGPAQLALAILAHHFGKRMSKTEADHRALQLYQRFKWKVVGRLPIDETWTLTTEEIDKALQSLQKEELV